MANENKYSSNVLFDKWKCLMDELGGERFSAASRKDCIEKLTILFIANGIDYDDAVSFKNSVIDVLTTPHRRSKADYRKWREAVSEDFRGVLADKYVDDIEEESTKEKKLNTISNSYAILANDEKIKAWCIDTFGNPCPKKIIDNAHTIGHSLNIMYLDDNFK